MKRFKLEKIIPNPCLQNQLALITKGLGNIGLDTYMNSYNAGKFIYSLFCIGLVAYFFTISAILKGLDVYRDPIKLVEVLGMLVGSTGCLAKGVWFIVQRNNLKKILILALDHFDCIIKNSMEDKTMAIILKKGRNFVILYVLILVIGVLFLLMDFFTRPVIALNGFPGKLAGLQPPEKHPNTEISLIILTATCSRGVLIIFCYIGLFILLVSYAEGKIMWLSEVVTLIKFKSQAELKDLSRTISKYNETIKKKQKTSNVITVYDIIRYFVDKHCDAMEYCRAVNFIYGDIMLMEYILYLVCLCTILCQGQSPRAINVYLAIINCLGSMFTYCHFGQRLIDSCMKLEYAIYNSGWESLTVKDRKALLMSLRMAAAPPLLTIGGYFTLSYERFGSVLHSAYSIYTVFNNLTKKTDTG